MKKNNKPYSIIFDETQDIATIEQAALIIRYVYERNIKKMNVLKQQANFILKILESLGLSPNKLVGLSNDGASKMSGIYKGVAARITKNYRLRFIFLF